MGMEATVVLVSPRKSWALYLEGAVWLTRPQSLFSQVPIALSASAIAGGGLVGSGIGHVLLLIVFLTTFQAAMFVINDLHDADSDKVSAPYMPIASGVMTRRAALFEAIALGAVFLGCIFLLAQDWFGRLAVAATIPAALGTMKLYGATKSSWFSPLLGSTTFASAALWSWLLSGHRNAITFLVLFIVACLHGIHANLLAQLRDIEGDPKAGHLTLAAQWGPRPTMWVAASVRLVELFAVAVLWFVGGAEKGWMWLLPAVFLFVFVLTRMREVYASRRDRLGQTKALSSWIYVSFLTEVAVLGVVQPLIALPTAIFMFAWFKVVRRGYYYRLVGGRLATEVLATRQIGNC